MNTLTDHQVLFGHDDEQHIVAVEQLYGTNIAEVFTRKPDGTLTKRKEPFRPCIYTTCDEPAIDKIYEDVEQLDLSGGEHYDTLIRSTNPNVIFWFKKEAQDCYLPDFKSQYLLQSGKTLFKEMTVYDAKHLSLDIEVIDPDNYGFTNPNRPQDQIVMAQLEYFYQDKVHSEVFMQVNKAYTHDRSHVKIVDNEQSLLRAVQKRIVDYDPDIIIGHNVMDYDFDYILKRCALHNIEFRVGRDNSVPRTHPAKLKTAERDREYPNTIIYGRHIIDTELLARKVDMVKRELPSYSLKDIVKYLGKADPNRTYIPGNEITWHWFNDPYSLIDYGLDDTSESRMVYDYFIGSAFYGTQFTPMSYQNMFRQATESQITNIYLRTYLYELGSVKKPDESEEYEGAYTDTFVYGHIGRAVGYADFESLYPTLANILDVKAGGDHLNVFQRLNGVLKDQRFIYKNKYIECKKQGDTYHAEQYNAQQAAYKITLNTAAYGVLASASFPWNNYEGASAITAGGRKYMNLMIDTIREDGGQVIRLDTDGALIIPPDDYNDEDLFELYCEKLTSHMPEGMVVGVDGWFDDLITIDKKSYAWRNGDVVKLKGSTLKSRSLEPFNRKMIDDVLTSKLLYGNERCATAYSYWFDMIMNRMLDADEIAERGNINMSLEQYNARKKQNEIEGVNRYNPIPAYEVALATRRNYRVGDAVQFWVRRGPLVVKKVRNNYKYVVEDQPKYEKAKPIDEYDPEMIDVLHYIGRLEDGVKRFIVVFTPEEMQELFDVKLGKPDITKRNNILKGKHEE